MDINSAPFRYIIYNDIKVKYHQGFIRKDSEVTHFIVHGTAGGNTALSNLNWMLSGGYIGNGIYRSEYYKKGVCLFQYIICRTGKIYEIINPHNFVYHSSTGGSSENRTGFDRHTIGVELTNPDRADNGTYTIMQYKALVWLYRFLAERFPNMKDIYSHNLIKKEKTGESKNCPGKGFDWDKFSLHLDDREVNHSIIKYEHIGVL